jgi:hypothetical protein
VGASLPQRAGVKSRRTDTDALEGYFPFWEGPDEDELVGYDGHLHE